MFQVWFRALGPFRCLAILLLAAGESAAWGADPNQSDPNPSDPNLLPCVCYPHFGYTGHCPPWGSRCCAPGAPGYSSEGYNGILSGNPLPGPGAGSGGGPVRVQTRETAVPHSRNGAGGPPVPLVQT